MKSKTRADIEEMAFHANCRLFDFEAEQKILGHDSYIGLLAAYRLWEPSCFSWEPGEYELCGLYHRCDNDEYYVLPTRFLDDDQQRALFAAISGETIEDIIENEYRQSRRDYQDRKKNA